MAVVTGPCQAFGGDRAVLGAGPGLKRVEEREAHGLLKLEVALELDVGSIPEIVEVCALGRQEAVPAGVPRLRERRDDLVADCRDAAPARPAVRQELDDAKAVALRESAAKVIRPTSGLDSANESVPSGPSTMWSMPAPIRSSLRLVE